MNLCEYVTTICSTFDCNTHTHRSSLVCRCTHNQTKHTKKINLWPLNSFKLISNEKIRFQWSVYCLRVFFPLSHVHCKLTTLKLNALISSGFFFVTGTIDMFSCDIKNYSEKNRNTKKEQTRPWQMKKNNHKNGEAKIWKK